MFKENSNPKPNIRIENINNQLELFKKDPEEFLSFLEVHSAHDENEVNRKLWQILQEIDVSPIDETGKPRFKKTPTTEDLMNLLKTELEQKEAA